MVVSFLVKGSYCMVLLVANATFADKNKRRSNRERCRQDLVNCLQGAVACQGGGYNVHCIPFERLCDGRPDCAWGEDEIYCAQRYRPHQTRFSTRTVVTTTSTTLTSTTTVTRTSTTFSTITSTSSSYTTTITTTTMSPTFTLWPISSWQTTVLVTTLPPYFAATRYGDGEIIPAGGSTCRLAAVGAKDIGMPNQYRLTRTTVSCTITGTVTVVCTAATTIT